MLQSQTVTSQSVREAIFDSQFSKFCMCHEYDTDVTVWLHAVKTTCECLHRYNSNERKFSPPGSVVRVSVSPSDHMFDKTSLPRSGGDRVIVGTGYPDCITASDGEMMLRSSRKGNWHTVYDSCDPVP